MSSVYMVRNEKGEWAALRPGSEWHYSTGRLANCTLFFSPADATDATAVAGGTVVEFVQRAEVQELVATLRELHDFAEPSTHYRHADRSRQAFEATAKVLKKWEPAA